MTKDDKKPLICRVCINEVEPQAKIYNIFESYENLLAPCTSRDDIVIAEKLKACADLKIKKDDGRPHRICPSCLLDLEHAYNFRKRCQKSDDILRIAAKVNDNIEYKEVPVKEESGDDSENYDSDDEATPLQNDMLKTVETVSVDVIKFDKKVLQELRPKSGQQTANNNSLKIKSKNLKLECQECSSVFKSKSELRSHRQREHNKLPVTCPSCKLQFKSFQAYHKHQTNRPKTCVSLSNLRIEGEGVSRHFYCKQCDYNSKSVNNSVHHLVVHTRNCQYKCDQCDRSFVRVITLRAHKERTHKQYYGQKTCHICGMVFQGFTLFDSHMRRHREKNKARCDICHKIFATKSSLYTHKKTHSETRSFACEKCPAKFRTSAVLNSHKKVHGEKVISCKVCGYKVKNPYIVKKHENEHNPNNVACRVCGKFFESDVLLAQHVKIHEDRRHPCGYCDKAYNARKILTEHLRKVHQIYVSSSDLKGVNVKKMKKLKSDLDL